MHFGQVFKFGALGLVITFGFVYMMSLSSLTGSLNYQIYLTFPNFNLEIKFLVNKIVCFIDDIMFNYNYYDVSLICLCCRSIVILNFKPNFFVHISDFPDLRSHLICLFYFIKCCLVIFC